MANQYTNINKYDTLKYSPESFRDMAIAPIAMRERHDSANQFNDDLLLQLDNIEVPAEFQEQFNARKNAIKENINGLTGKINEIGAGNSNLMSEFRNMKRDYNSQVSNSGEIGRLKNMQDEFKSKYASAMQLNMQQKQNPETGKKNFDMDRAAYLASINPDDLSNPNAGIKAFEPRYAPEYTDVIDEHKRIQSLIGEKTSQINWNDVEMVPNPSAPGSYMYQTKQGVKTNSSNIANLKAVNEIMKSSALDPNSKIGQNLQWMNPDKTYEQNMDAFLKDANMMTNVMRKDAYTENTQSKLTDPNGGSKGSTTKENKVDEKGNLISIMTGSDHYNGMDYSEFMSGNKLKAWEEMEENGTITEKEIMAKNAYLQQRERMAIASSQKGVSGNIDKSIKEYYTKHKDQRPSTDAKENFKILSTKEEVAESIDRKEDFIKEIQSIDYDSMRKRVLEETGEKIGYMPGSHEVQRKGLIDSMRRSIDFDRKALDTSMKSHVPKEDLLYSKMYKFGSGKVNNDNEKIFKESVNNKGAVLLGVARNSGGLFTSPGEGVETTAYKDFNNEESDSKELEQLFINGEAEITGMSLISMGSTGSSQLVFDYSSKGDSASGRRGGKVVIDYDSKSPDSSMLEDILNSMKEVLDEEGNSIIQSIQDNKKLAPLSIDDAEYSVKGMSKSQSEMFKKLSKNLRPSKYDNEAYRGVDYTAAPNREFNMVRTSDGYYQLMIGEKLKRSDTGALLTKDWMNREMAKAYSDGASTIPDLRKASTPAEEVKLIEWVQDFAQTATKEEGITRVGRAKDQKDYQLKRREFLKLLEANQNNRSEQVRYAKSFLDYIGNMRISHRNKIRFM